MPDPHRLNSGRLRSVQRSGATLGALRVLPERGLTGLETAIILIAFVVVASVFGYTVLSAGIFATEKSKEAAYAGLGQAHSALRIVGEVRAASVAAIELDDADSLWSYAAARVTMSLDTSDYQEGSASLSLGIDSVFTTGLIAFKNLGSGQKTGTHYSAGLWIKSDIALAAGQVTLGLYLYSNCETALETLSLPAIPASTWKQVRMRLSNPTGLSDVSCIDLLATADFGAATIKVDLVEAPAEVQQVLVPIATALQTESVNLAVTTDTDTDGLLSDEASQIHRLTIDYQDTEQLVSDITWTATALGKSDGDSLLEPHEKRMLTIDLRRTLPLPSAYTQFTLHIKPSEGAPLTLTKKVPATVDTVMVLR